MPLLDLCEKYFNTRDVYSVFEIDEKALPKDVKKAYYKVSLKVHPDRVSEQEKEIATEKFKILSKLYQVLSDKDKRALYDEQKRIIDDDDDDMEGKLTSWLELWRKLFKPITIDQITEYEKSYQGSDTERKDIKKAYLSAKGCWNRMNNEIPFMKVKDEPRIQEIVSEMIKAGEVPEYAIFVNEPAQKKKRRHNKYAREAVEAEEIKKKMVVKEIEIQQAPGENSLEMQLAERRQAREGNFDSFMDKLMAKYGNEDDSEAIAIEDLGKRTKKKQKPTPKKATTSKDAPEEKLHKVANGRVKKRKSK